ncbi:MAG: amidohydrolase family protein [Planctomycetales bacterium]
MNVFDAHFHIIDPAFPLVPNDGFLPDRFTPEDYLAHSSQLNVISGAVVSGSFQVFDQGYLLHALKKLGNGFVGVTQLPFTVTDEEIVALNSQGVRAVRFNLKRGGSESVEQLQSFAQRIFDLAGWHVELYVDGKELARLESVLRDLPAVSIDHLGLSATGLPALQRLVEGGVRVKATGFGRVDFDVASAIKAIHAINPQALMFGTDLPSTRAPRLFHPDDLALVIDALGTASAQQVLWDNAARFYRLAR